MVSIGKTNKGLISYDVDVGRVFKAKKGEAIITLREPTTREYMQLGRMGRDGKEDEVVDIVLGLICGTTITSAEDDKSPVDLNVLRMFLKDNGSYYLSLYTEWQKMLPFDLSK